MRKAAFGLMMVLVCVGAFAQNATPQWKVKKAIQVISGSSEIPQTVLFTPTKIGEYRFTAYISAVGPIQNTGWAVQLNWTDLTSVGQLLAPSAALSGVNPATALAPTPFSPKPGTPVSFALQPLVPTPVGSSYSFWFTIEQLE